MKAGQDASIPGTGVVCRVAQWWTPVLPFDYGEARSRSYRLCTAARWVVAVLEDDQEPFVPEERHRFPELCSGLACHGCSLLVAAFRDKHATNGGEAPSMNVPELADDHPSESMADVISSRASEP